MPGQVLKYQYHGFVPDTDSAVEFPM